MPAYAYGRLAAASLTMAVLLFAFSDSFAVAVPAFGLLAIGSVALCIAVGWDAPPRDGYRAPGR
jgi:hypothetical protein